MRYCIVLLLLTTTVLAAPVVEQRREAAYPALPSPFPSTANAKLPNIFKLFDGITVTTRAQFESKSNEVSAALQAQELGGFPKKLSIVTATFSGFSLSITSSEEGKSVSFPVSIKKPNGTDPFPAIIAYGAPSTPVPANVATITFNNGDTGGRNAGALIAWVWGVDRIIDALEATPSVSIDLKRVDVTGCSRNGKGAFVATALVNRIVLGIPQESGSSGAACWRIFDSEKANGKNIQTSSQIFDVNLWFSTHFNSLSTKSNTLATDHHQLAGLAAPHGLVVIENEVDRLCPLSTTACMKAGRLIYKAPCVPDNMDFTGSGNHNHCSFPSNQQTELTAFIKKFLLHQDANTVGIK